MKHLKHLKHRFATCAFKRNIYLLLRRKRRLELDGGVELDATEWLGGHWCGAHWWHGPRQGPQQADGARMRWEARVQPRARGLGARWGRSARARAAQPRAGSVS
jgi:hypothetical protein